MVHWDVKGKSVLITGGASGLGAAYVQGFLKAGIKQVAVLDIAEDAGKQFTADMNKTYPGKVIFVKCDVGNEECITAAFNEVVAKFKTVDIVFNNAGIMNDAPHIWRKMCDVNVQGLISFTYKAIKHMRTDDGGAGGTIINIASVAAITKGDLLPAYSATKTAVLQFSQCIAGNLFEQAGIRILTLCPGPTDTPLLHNLKERGGDERAGEKLENVLTNSEVVTQSVDSAVKAMLKMYEDAENGSIWLTTDNKPVKNITPVIDDAFNSFMNAMRN
ncbi:PREDICTED: 15-hydroxyprostaglandin dehydrogenase [NAD(+)]-like [Papilio xuthus]|uniref:15-hydroxyprostaglandin dehydrogenase [NAD(+)] n=1 Tax=Papilio xuthus TaxID=66420 RepID=A0A194QFX2_PAPXU|nr:PREDICTED: 15-hydroxyprostaglandin dehydrogenase [NAD(+)]-like [Papilio xuthus]KPJ02346.1 15-hydroxyprostaglandin dehydrogenase [NAD+] [Papilio xuthus]